MKYNLACTQALKLKPSQAFLWLGQKSGLIMQYANFKPLNNQ